jgi:hypothetical protein
MRENEEFKPESSITQIHIPVERGAEENQSEMTEMKKEQEDTEPE